MADQDGMRAIADVLERMATGTLPPQVERFGGSSTIYRIRVGQYRLLAELAEEDPEPVIRVFYLGKTRPEPQ